MQHRRATDPSSHTRTTHRGRDPHARIPGDLTTLVDTNPYPDRAYASTHAGRHTARAHTHANIERPHWHPNSHAGGGCTPTQCTQQCQSK